MARLYVPLDVNCQDDPAIVRAGPDAEHLFLRGLQLAKRLGTDGHLDLGHVYRLALDLTIVRIGDATPTDLADRLVSEGLWERNGTGYQIVRWLAHNRPQAEIDAAREAETERKRRWRDGPATQDRPVADPGQEEDEPATPESGRTPTSTRRGRDKRESDTESESEPRARSKRGTRIPDEFLLTEEMLAWAKAKCPDIDVALHTQRFVNYWKAASGRNAVKLDWLRTWQNWMLKEQDAIPQWKQTKGRR